MSVMKNNEWEFSKMGIDMSAAFDTIVRNSVLTTLTEAGCTEDDIRLFRYLLSNTKLQVKIKKTLSLEIESTLGAFQGDSLSGKIFTLVLARALREVRVTVNRPIIPISTHGIPEEWEYADDVDFVEETMEDLQGMYPIVKEVLKNWNLFLNDEKTEFTRFYLAEMDEVNEAGKSIRTLKCEDWRNSKSLGSLICSIQDIKRRCQLGNAAFSNYDKCWLQGTKIPLAIKIKLYNALVTSVMIYNSNSWCAPAHIIEKLDTTQRRHLRRILNIHWPTGHISNNELYRRCNVGKLSDRILKFRWTMLGHVLRSSIDTPAFLSLKFALSNNLKSRKSRHQMNLFNVICNDLKSRNYNLESIDELYQLREVASDRSHWKLMF